jgi:hypothetical protein
VNTGKPIPEYQLEKVMSKGRGLPKSYFNARIKMNDTDINYGLMSYELRHLNTLNPKIKEELIKKINRFDFIELVTTIPDDLVIMIIKYKGKFLIRSYIKSLHFFSQNRDEIAKMIIITLGDRYDVEFIKDIIDYSKNPDDLFKQIINNEGKSLSSFAILHLLHNSKKPDDLVNLIINVKGDTLESEDIGLLLFYSKNTNDVAKMIIEIVGNKLDSYSIRELMRYSSNRDLTKNLLLKNGISKDEINNSIRMYRIETDPIP